MARSVRRFSDLPAVCQNPFYRRSADTGELVRQPCKMPSCSKEDRRLWGRRQRARAGDLFTRLPATHHLRVTVDDDLSFDEVNRLVGKLTKRLATLVNYFVDFVHFTNGRRHDHIVVRYTGDHANPKELFKALIDKVFVPGLIASHKEVSEIREEPFRVATYMVKHFASDGMNDIEMPPEGFKGQLIRATKGVFEKLKKQEPAVVAPVVRVNDLPWSRIEMGDEGGEAWEFRFDEPAITAHESGDGPQHVSSPSGDTATPHHGSTSPDSARADRQQEAPGATATSTAPIFPRERLHELHEPVRQAFARRADHHDGSLDRFALLAVLQCYVSVSDGWIVGADDAIDGLAETGVLHESAPGRFVLVAKPSKAA